MQSTDTGSGVPATPPPSGIIVIDLAKGLTTEPINIETTGAVEVVFRRNTFQPGETSGWHTHPGPLLIVLTSGTATYADASDPACTPRTVPAGQALLMPVGHVHVLSNEGTEPFEAYSIGYFPRGAPQTSSAEKPTHCY